MTADELRQGFRHELAACVCVVLFLLYATVAANLFWTLVLACGGVGCGVGWVLEPEDR